MDRNSSSWIGPSRRDVFPSRTGGQAVVTSGFAGDRGARCARCLVPGAGLSGCLVPSQAPCGAGAVGFRPPQPRRLMPGAGPDEGHQPRAYIRGRKEPGAVAQMWHHRRAPGTEHPDKPAPGTLMSSNSAITLWKARGARCTLGVDTVCQPGPPRRRVTVEPEQLLGRPVRTRIRPGHAVTPGAAMEHPIVGIDVSKSEYVVAVHPTGEQWTSATTSEAVERLVGRLRALAPTVIVIEATGGYEMALAADRKSTRLNSSHQL